jgi:uncharacterized membrane protein
MLRFFGRNVLTGLVTILPLTLTFYILYWLVVSSESALGSLIRMVLPDDLYRPGMGVVAGLAVIFIIGLLMHAYVVQRLFAMGEQLFYRMPMIRTVYRAIRDFIDYFSPSAKREFDQVVAVSIGNTGMEVIGFVTQAEPAQLPEDFRGDDCVLVYIPLSYMIGGYTLLTPRQAIRPLAMSMDAAMRFTLTAGVTGMPTKVSR